MTKSFVIHRAPPTFDHVEAFTERTYDLIEDLVREREATGGAPLLTNAIVIASDLLLDEHGPRASWDQLELTAFFRRLTEAPALLPYAIRFREALLLFLEHLARRGLVTAGTVARARAVRAPLEGQNRAERRFKARQRRHARRRGVPLLGDEEVRVLLPRDIERMLRGDDS